MVVCRHGRLFFRFHLVRFCPVRISLERGFAANTGEITGNIIEMGGTVNRIRKSTVYSVDVRSGCELFTHEHHLEPVVLNPAFAGMHASRPLCSHRESTYPRLMRGLHKMRCFGFVTTCIYDPSAFVTPRRVSFLASVGDSRDAFVPYTRNL